MAIAAITQSESQASIGTKMTAAAISRNGSARCSPKRLTTLAATSEPITIPAIGGTSRLE